MMNLRLDDNKIIELREHQQSALLSLENMRKNGESIALLYHATGTGKTFTAVSDAKRLGRRTYKKILGYFKPEFTLGLTATPDRADVGSSSRPTDRSEQRAKRGKTYVRSWKICT